MHLKLYIYILSANRTRIIFKHGAYAMIWDDMLSLNKNEEIKVGIIDAWSAILNQKEKARSSSSPCRFFASTFVCVSLKTTIKTFQKINYIFVTCKLTSTFYYSFTQL